MSQAAEMRGAMPAMLKDAAFDWQDPLGIEGELTEEERMVRDSTRAFAQERLMPGVIAAWREEQYDPSLIGEMGKLGLLGATIPEQYGGAGLGYVAYGLIARELERVDSGYRSTMSVQSSLVMYPIFAYGSDAQRRKYLPKLISGEHVGALAMSEPNAGSDVVSMRLRAEKQGDRYVLNGNKMWITNGPDADTLVVYAKTDVSGGPRGITAFVVEKTFKGFSTAQKLDKLGMRGSNTCELVFQNCEVPEENVLGAVNDGVRVLMSGLDYERVVLAGGPLGIMQSCLDVVLPYVHDRQQFGQPIGQFQLMQGILADMYTTMNACRAYVYAVAQACDRGETARKDAAGAILYASEKATWMAGEAVRCLGGNGYINEFPTGRLWRDAKLYEIGAGTSEIRRMLIGRELFTETV